MIVKAVEATYARLPLLPEDWRRHAPNLCEGIDPDYLLIDLGPVEGRPRYTVIGLRSDCHSLYLLDTLREVHAPATDGGLGIVSSLFVPLARVEQQHRGHVAALYQSDRRFDEGDVERLQRVARRLFSFLTEG